MVGEFGHGLGCWGAGLGSRFITLYAPEISVCLILGKSALLHTLGNFHRVRLCARTGWCNRKAPPKRGLLSVWVRLGCEPEP